MLPAVLIAAELAFLILATMLIVRVWRQFKRNRAEVGDSWTALEEAVGRRVGPIAARLIVGEPKLWAAIFLWISARALAVAESGAHHHFGVRRHLDHRDLRLLACIPPPGDGAGACFLGLAFSAKRGSFGEMWIRSSRRRWYRLEGRTGS
jgi:hypothetical protein